MFYQFDAAIEGAAILGVIRADRGIGAVAVSLEPEGGIIDRTRGSRDMLDDTGAERAAGTALGPSSPHRQRLVHVWLLRAFLRGQVIWDRLVPLETVKSWIKLAPFMARVGIIRPVWVQLELGVKILLDPSDLLSHCILTSSESVWQPWVWEALSSGLGDGSVVLDVGAHIGYFTLKSGVRVGQRGRVVAFEPNPGSLETLRANVAASHAANVTIVPVACTDRGTTLTLYDAFPRHNSGGASLSRANAGERSQGVPVCGRPIDDVLRELGIQWVDAMKVDVEGAELYALQGATETLLRSHPKIVIEVQPDALAGMNTTVEELFSFLKQVGYTRGRQIGPEDWEWTAE